MKKNILVIAAVCLLLSVSSCNNPQVIIQSQVTAINRTCPIEFGNGLTLASVENDGRYIVYNFKGPDGMYFNQTNVTDEMKNQIVQTLNMQAQSDKETDKLLSALKESGVGIIYHYYGDSESVMDVIIESSDL